MTKKKSTARNGVAFLVRFRSEEELTEVKKAAGMEQDKMRDMMGKKFPNISRFITVAAIEKARKIINRNGQR